MIILHRPFAIAGFCHYPLQNSDTVRYPLAMEVLKDCKITPQKPESIRVFRPNIHTRRLAFPVPA